VPFTFKSGSVRLEYPLRANGGYRCRHCSPRLFSSTEFPAAAALQLDLGSQTATGKEHAGLAHG
jgi:hypothetical protein